MRTPLWYALLLGIALATARTTAAQASHHDFLAEWVARFAEKQIQQEDYAGALATLNHALAWAQDNVRLLTLRGELHLLLYEWDNALADFNRALMLQPNDARAHFQRGMLYYTRAQRKEAYADFACYLALAPNGQFADFARQALASIAQEQRTLGE